VAASQSSQETYYVYQRQPANADAAKPTLTAYHVTEVTEDGGKVRWTELGVFFSHKYNQGGTLILDALPIHSDGRIVLRAPSKR
jgi:hypothetical protein